MRIINFFVAAVVTVITFFTLQAYVKPYGWNRPGLWNRHHFHNGRAWESDDYYYPRYRWHDHPQAPQHDEPQQYKDSSSAERFDN